eukprot:scaffold323684_cov21-Tisochrysis_lutea.AAC.1
MPQFDAFSISTLMYLLSLARGRGALKGEQLQRHALHWCAQGGAAAAPYYIGAYGIGALDRCTILPVPFQGVPCVCSLSGRRCAQRGAAAAPYRIGASSGGSLGGSGRTSPCG